MLKIYLVSVFPVQPLSFSFSTSAFQFQHLCLSVLALSLFCFSPLAHLLSSFFLFQRFSPFCSVFQRLPFLLFVFWFSASFFSFQFTCCPFFQPKNIFQPKTVLSPKPKTFCFKSPNVLLLLVQPLFSFVRASFSVSCQLLRPKIFSLDASHLFYLNKSLFSSNLE